MKYNEPGDSTDNLWFIKNLAKNALKIKYSRRYSLLFFLGKTQICCRALYRLKILDRSCRPVCSICIEIFLKNFLWLLFGFFSFVGEIEVR